MNKELKPLINKLTLFAKNRMGFSNPPRLFLRNDTNNSKMMLGKTAFYDPKEETITLFTNNRHPKDILRSYAHELVHHTQNLRGDLTADKCGEMGEGYAQNNRHMREMEREAYEIGNMCFRDWEDSLDDKTIYIIKLAESRFLKEKKLMTTKITKNLLKEMIEKQLESARPLPDAYEAEREAGYPDSQHSDKSSTSTIPVQDALKMISDISSDGVITAQELIAAGEELQKQAGGSNYRDSQEFRDDYARHSDQHDELAAYQNMEEVKAEQQTAPAHFLEKPPETPKERKSSSTFSIKPTKKKGAKLVATGTFEEASSGDESGMQEDGEPIEEILGTAAAYAAGKLTGDKIKKVKPGMKKIVNKGLQKAKKFGRAQGQKFKKATDKIDSDIKGTVKNVKDKFKKGADNINQKIQKLEENKEFEERGNSKPKDNKMKEGSRIQTPEQERALYGQRFTPKNNRLFEELVKQWTK